MIKCEKIFPSLYKETQGMQRLDFLRYTKMPYPPKITNKKKSDHRAA